MSLHSAVSKKLNFMQMKDIRLTPLSIMYDWHSSEQSLQAVPWRDGEASHTAMWAYMRRAIMIARSSEHIVKAKLDEHTLRVESS